jgi:hypothetical protein
VIQGWRRGFACVVSVLSAAATCARAQDKQELGVSVTFGWQGKLPSDRWAPITVAVSPGEAPLAGTVTASYQQDSAGDARISVPFAATPNATTPVHILAWLPDNCMRVDLSLADDKGQVRWSQSFETIVSNFAQPLPPLLSSLNPLMVLVGRSTLFESMRDWPAIVASSAVAGQASVASSTDTAWTHVTAGRADPATLPNAWAAYDGVSVMVVTPDSQSPPDVRGVEAIHTWVASGGRLVVRVDSAGDAWRAWLPESLAAGVSIDTPRAAPVPDLAARAMERVGSRMRAVRESPDAGFGVTGVDGPAPVPADTITVRAITVPTDAWTIHWAGDKPDNGLVVEGRYGFGGILLVGFDPGKTTSVVSSIGSGAVWRAVIDPVMADVLDEVSLIYGHQARNWRTGLLPSQSAVNTVLERVARVPGVGTAVILVIVACVFMLALLVGPVDYFVLRRFRWLQRSWLTALAWVALASAAAFAGPRMVRTESTRINRVSIEDCIVGDQAASAEPAGSVAFRCGVTGVYSGDSGVASFTGADRASWWRGAAARYVNETRVRGSGLIPIMQQAAGGASGSLRGGPLLELPVALWTFRTFADESTPRPSLRARVRQTGDSPERRWSVMLSGLPAGARVARATLRLNKAWVTLGREPRLRMDPSGYTTAEPVAPVVGDAGVVEGGVWVAVFPERWSDPATPSAWGVVDSHSYYQDEQASDERPGVVARLPGPSRREGGIERLVSTGKWAAVYLEVKNWPVDTPVQWHFEGEHTRILRVLTPIQEE